MKQKILSLLLALILAPTLLYAQIPTPPGFIPVVTFANLPTGIGAGTVRYVSNSDGTACNGSGAILTLCVYDGADWVLGGTGSITGAPTDATYIVQTANGGLSAEQALGALATGILKNTTTTGVLSIAVAGDFPTLNQNTTGNAATSTALAANGANCPAGQFGPGVDTLGAAEDCTPLPTSISGTANQISASAATGAITLSVPANSQLSIAKITNLTSNGFLKTTAGDGTLSVDTAGYLPLSAGSGNALTGQLWVGSDGIEFIESATAPTCGAGNYNLFGFSTTGKLRGCENGTLFNLNAQAPLLVREEDGAPSDAAVTTIRVPNGSLSVNSAGDVSITIAGGGDVTAASTFGTDNSCIRSDGTSKGVQSSGANCTIDDVGNLTIAGSLTTGDTSSGVLTFTGATSGSAQLGVADAAGTPARINLPTATGAANAVLVTDGGTPQQWSYQATTGTGNISRVTNTVLVTPNIGAATGTSLVLTGNTTAATFTSTAADPADTGVVRLGNAELIAWEAATPGTDLTCGVNSSDIFSCSTVINATTGFRIGGAAASNQALVGNGTNFVATAIPISIAGTANEIAASGATGAITLSIPADFSLAGKTSSIPYPVGATPTVDAAGEIALDTDFFGASLGGLTFFDGTAARVLVHVTGAGTTGQIPKKQADGTIAWDTDNTGAGGGCSPAGGNDQILTDTGAAGCASEAQWTITTNVLTAGASGKADFSAASGTDGLKVPVAAGAAPTADGAIAVNSTTHLPVVGSNGATLTLATLASGVTNISSASGEINALTSKATPTTSDLLMIEDAAASNAKKKITIDAALAANDARTKTLTNTSLDVEGPGNTLKIYDEHYSAVAGCDNATAGPVWNNNTSASPAYACEGTNTRLATAAFDDTTDEGIFGDFRLPTGFTGAIDVIFRWKAAATTGAVGWCLQLVRVPTGATSDPPLPEQAAGNCVSSTVAGTTLQETEATISNVTCTSCAAGDRVNFRISRDANGGAVTDSMTGDALLMGWMRRVRRAVSAF